MDYIKTLNEAPVLTMKNISDDKFRKFAAGACAIEEKLSEIKGIWWIAENTGDGGAQVILKADTPVKTLDRIMLNGLLASLFDLEIIYDYDRDFVNNSGKVKSDASFREWLENGQIYTIYNKESGIICRL